MKNTSLPIVTILLLVLLFTGCESTAVSRRISENPATFSALAPDQKAYVKDGIVFPGDSVEMAYMALGKPDSVETREKDEIKVIMWTYNKYYPAGMLADFLTDYSRSRNVSLLRFPDIEVGSVTVHDNVPGRGSIPGVQDNGQHTEGSMNEFHLPDIPVYKLYVFYYREKISDVMIESLDGTVFTWKEDAIAIEEARQLR